MDDDLLDRAVTEIFSEIDLAALAERLTPEVMVTLLRAGTAASRANLMAAKATLGRQPHPTSGDPAEIRRAAKRALATRPHTDRSRGLPFGITSHAIEQFCSRHGLSAEEVYEEARESSPTREKTTNGDHIWVGRRGIRFVIRYDRNPPARICVTVLPVETQVGSVKRACRGSGNYGM